MTVLVGVLCKDGVVIGSDSAATFAAGQSRTIEQRVKKVEIVGGAIVAGTGEVGLGQRFNAIVAKGCADNLFRKPPVEIGKSLSASARKDFAETGLTGGQIGFGALVAFACNGKPCLCEIQTGSLQPELKTEGLWYVSMGSGQPIADPFLGFIREVFWENGLPTVREGIFAVTWTISQAIKLNPGGVNEPIQIAVLSAGNDGKLAPKSLDQAEIDQHEGSINGAIEHLRSYRDILSGQNIATAEPIPEA